MFIFSAFSDLLLLPFLLLLFPFFLPVPWLGHNEQGGGHLHGDLAPDLPVCLGLVLALWQAASEDGVTVGDKLRQHRVTPVLGHLLNCHWLEQSLCSLGSWSWFWSRSWSWSWFWSALHRSKGQQAI